MEGNIHPLGRALFNMQRFQILQAKRNPQTEHTIPDHYAFAWYAKVYPFYDSAELHEDLKDYFEIPEDLIHTVTEYAGAEYDAGRLHTFYDYEQHFGVRQGDGEGLTRGKLINIFRYCYLSDVFEDDFWKKLIEQYKHPAEASTIVSDFKSERLYLI